MATEKNYGGETKIEFLQRHLTEAIDKLSAIRSVVKFYLKTCNNNNNGVIAPSSQQSLLKFL